MRELIPDIFAFAGIAMLAGGVWQLFGWGWALVVGGLLVYLTTIFVIWKANATEPSVPTDS